MLKRIVCVLMLLVLLFSFVTLGLGVSLPEAEGMIAIPNSISSQWLAATSWNKTYGGTNDDSAFSVVQTSDGGYAIAGHTASYGAGLFDFWLVKTYENGTIQWNKTYGGTNYEIAYSIVQTSDGGYALTGETYTSPSGDKSDFWLVKAAANGTMLWNKTYGGTSNDGAQSVVQTSDGGYAIAGYTYSYGAGSADFWLVKTYENGTIQWNKTYGGTSSDGAQSVVQTSDGGYAVAGQTRSYGAGISDFWLVKTAANGTMLWNKTYGGTATDEAYSVVQTSDGGYTIAGQTYSYGAGNSDSWLVKLTPETVYIRGDGSVDPSTAPVVRNGSLYTLTDNITSLTDGIVIQKDSVTLDGARYTVQGSGGGCGIVLGSHVTVRNVNVRSFYYGTVGNWTFYSVVSQSNLTDNFYGVWLYSVNSTVSQNTISGNTYGVGTYLSSSGNNISDNVITNNWQGIYLRDTSLTVISRNKFTDNDNGAIGLRESNDNTITRNNMENNLAGIWLWKSGSTHNVISENNITGNTQCGVQLSEFASNNAFYHNNFENNTIQVSLADNTTTNSWDNSYPSGGNYWSNYLNRTDLCRGVFQNITGSDAIADTGFSLDVNNRDNYPLMGLFGSPTATGTNITVFPTPDVGLTFKNVTTAGSTTVNETATGPPLPLAYNLVGQYCDIETTAAYTDKITLRFIYNDTGMSQLIEENLRLGHWNETSDSWEDITTLVDTENNVIYGATDSLSIFGIRSLDNNADPLLSFVSAACSKTVVGQGFSVNINVTVSNIDVTPKTVDINLFADADLIGRQQVADLDPGEQRTINFIWQVPSDYNKGNHTLIVGDLAGWIIVAIVGDLVGIGTFPNALPDGKVDIKDLAAMAKCYGANYPNPQYVANYDLTGSTPGLADGKIDIKDLATAAKNYGKIDP